MYPPHQEGPPAFTPGILSLGGLVHQYTPHRVWHRVSRPWYGTCHRADRETAAQGGGRLTPGHRKRRGGRMPQGRRHGWSWGVGSSGHRKGPRVLASRPHLTGLPPSHQVPSGALAPMENTAGNLTQAARCLYSTLGAAGLSRGGAGGWCPALLLYKAGVGSAHRGGGFTALTGQDNRARPEQPADPNRPL